MTQRLHRYYGHGHLHFITCSCYRRQPRLGSPRRRDRFLETLEQVRQRYRFVVVGYVVMPEHFHLLIGEPEQGTPSTRHAGLEAALCSSGVAGTETAKFGSGAPVGGGRTCLAAAVYDFNVFTREKWKEKLLYMHRNPVKRGLALEPEQWGWSSYRWYLLGEVATVKVCGWGPAELKVRTAA